jgi:hypothetical protein
MLPANLHNLQWIGPSKKCTDTEFVGERIERVSLVAVNRPRSAPEVPEVRL